MSHRNYLLQVGYIETDHMETEVWYADGLIQLLQHPLISTFIRNCIDQARPIPESDTSDSEEGIQPDDVIDFTRYDFY